MIPLAWVTYAGVVRIAYGVACGIACALAATEKVARADRRWGRRLGGVTEGAYYLMVLLHAIPHSDPFGQWKHQWSELASGLGAAAAGSHAVTLWDTLQQLTYCAWPGVLAWRVSTMVGWGVRGRDGTHQYKFVPFQSEGTPRETGGACLVRAYPERHDAPTIASPNHKVDQSR